MALRSRKNTYDSYTPPVSSSRTMNGALYRRSSKETIQSYKGSISNFSVHTTSTVATRKDLIDRSEQGPGGVPSISDRKSFHSLDKPTFRLRNQSQSTVGTICETGSVRSSTGTSTSKQENRSSNITSSEDEASDEDVSPQSTPRSSVYNLSILPEPSPSSSPIYGVPPSTPLGDPLTKPYGGSQPFAITKTPTADDPPPDIPLPFYPQQIAWVPHRSRTLFLPVKKPRPPLSQVRSPATRSTTLPLHLLYRVAALQKSQLTITNPRGSPSKRTKSSSERLICTPLPLQATGIPSFLQVKHPLHSAHTTRRRVQTRRLHSLLRYVRLFLVLFWIPAEGRVIKSGNGVPA
jgi:hypothetical protein